MADPKTVLRSYLQESREAILWKLEGLSEREARLPRSMTGNNLLGLLKHCLNVEAGYFGPTFGRSFPAPEELVAMEAYESDPQADWYATESESTEGLIDLYKRVWAFCDETIESLPLEAPGKVPWWAPGRQDVTLQRVIIHVTCDLARHAGQADLMREEHDGQIGLEPDNANLPQAYDWSAYSSRLTALADRFA